MDVAESLDELRELNRKKTEVVLTTVGVFHLPTINNSPSQIDIDDMMDQMMDDQANLDEEGDGAGGDAEGVEAQQIVKAIPTFIVGGTLQGGVFRVNLATCNITVESGDLVCVMEWYKVAHDGPVTTVTRSPFFSDLVLTVSSYFMIIQPAR